MDSAKRYNYYMKKFFKWLMIVIVIVASVGGTCYVFYTNLSERRESFSAVDSFLNSSVQADFDSNLTRIEDISGNRFNTLIEINADLEDITRTLIPYLTIIRDREEDIDETAIVEALETMENSRDSANILMEDYFIHIGHTPSFNVMTGANASYRDICAYLVDYAEFILLMNNTITSYMDSTSDVKFSVIDLYSRVIINDCSRLIQNSDNITVINSTSNINILITNVNFSSGYLMKGDDISVSFNSYANKFITDYALCAKQTVANDLSNLITSASENSTNINETTAYSFKQMFGIN